jgi:hypothetical protein
MHHALITPRPISEVPHKFAVRVLATTGNAHADAIVELFQAVPEIAAGLGNVFDARGANGVAHDAPDSGGGGSAGRAIGCCGQCETGRDECEAHSWSGVERGTVGLRSGFGSVVIRLRR